MRRGSWIICAALLCGFASNLLGQEMEINERRAKFHYQMFCQGCHTADGHGFNSVPALDGFVGNFLRIPEGRAYLIRVPGAANADLSDEYLAELMNWIVREFSHGSAPAVWSPYTGTEISGYRKEPLMEVFQYRQQLVQKIENLATGDNSHVN